MPGSAHVGVSQRIESEAERERLKRTVAGYVDELGGYIIRTAAEGVGELELEQDAAFLKRLWRKILERKQKYPPCKILVRGSQSGLPGGARFRRCRARQDPR